MRIQCACEEWRGFAATEAGTGRKEIPKAVGASGLSFLKYTAALSSPGKSVTFTTQFCLTSLELTSYVNSSGFVRKED